MFFSIRVTLVAPWTGAGTWVCKRLPSFHSFRGFRPRFRGLERRSSSPTRPACFSRFGTVSRIDHQQALSRLSRLSYSPSAFLADRRTWSKVRLCASPRYKLPALAKRYANPFEDFHPVSFLSFGPRPAGGFGRNNEIVISSSPALNTPAP